MTKIIKYTTALLILILAFFSYKFYQNYQFEKKVNQDWQAFIKPYNERHKAMEEAYKKEQEELVARAMKSYLLAKQDHYGGKTPEETLKLFVDALKKKDAKLAAKYYLPWEWEKQEKEMQEWSADESLGSFLRAYKDGNIKKRKRVSGIAVEIYPKNEIKYHYTIDMILNNQTGLWKIEKF